MKSVGATWTLMTDTDATSVSIMVRENTIEVKGTVGTTPPLLTDTGPVFLPGNGQMNFRLSEMFLGIAGVNRLWARSELPGKLWISHA